jgi:hypothetical protein
MEEGHEADRERLVMVKQGDRQAAKEVRHTRGNPDPPVMATVKYLGLVSHEHLSCHLHCEAQVTRNGWQRPTHSLTLLPGRAP